MSETEQRKRYTIAVDCDGVLHSYVSGWQGAAVLPDPPVDGAIPWLNEVAKDYDVAILTTRARDPEGAIAVAEYLRAHGFTGECVVTAEKIPALVYIDDRGWRFRGRFPTANQIRYGMRPWKTGDESKKTASDHLKRVGKEHQNLQEKHSAAKKALAAALERETRFAERAESLRAMAEFEEAGWPELAAFLGDMIGAER